MTAEAIAEAAFRMYRWHIREPSESRARWRFANLLPDVLEDWLGDAREAGRVFEIHRTGEDWAHG